MIQVDLTHMRRFIALPYEAALAPRLRIAHNHLQKNDGAGGDFTGWVRLPQEYDRQEFDRIQAAARRIQSDSRALVVIGIGGSYLGARGVIECLCSPNYNLRRKDTPNIYFVGNGLSDRQLRETMELLEGVDFSVNVISKSGTTTEPAVAFRFFRELLEKKYGPDGAARRIYATTDRQKGALKSLADQAGYETFVVPDDIGGRYSVLTAVGLLPIAVAGIDIRALMQGAALACRLVRLIRRKDWENTFYGTAALLVLPMMCTVFMVATSQASFYIPMSGGLALFLPVCFWLLDSSREGETACDAFRKCWNKAEKALILLTAAAVVYGSVFMSAVDQQAMYEGRQATKELSDLIAQTLVNEGYYDNEIPVMLVGNASNSPLFRTHELYHTANPYARVGLFMAETAGTIRFSWDAAFRDYTPIWLNLCDDKTYQKLLETEEIAEMPTFPQEGSIRKMDGVLVIKVSEEYHLDADWKNKMMSGEYD